MNILNKIKVGDTLYSTMLGNVTVIELCPYSAINAHIKAKDTEERMLYFSKEGKYTKNGECVLFPSKENRNWHSYYAPKFNINTLNPFDKVLVRDENNRCWTTGFYSHYEDNGDMRFFISSSVSWNQCIPYNEETKHLVGTNNMPDSYYITWNN